MIKKYIGITLISASMAFAGCSSNDDDDGPLDGVMDIVGGEGEGEGEGAGAGEGAESNTITPVLPADFTADPAATVPLVELLANDGRFLTIEQAVADAGLGQTLTDTELATIFAPTDTALEGVTLPTDQAELSALLQGHVVAGGVDNTLIANSVGSSVAALNGDTLTITADGSELFVNGVGIGEQLAASNGFIHVIDGVIGVGGEEEPVGGEEEPGEGGEGGDGVVAPGETDLGASLNNLSATGFTDYVAVHNASGLGTVYDDNGWTAFIPNNDAIPDAALASDSDAAFAILNNHIITTGVVAFADLAALGDTTTNSGLAVTFGGTAGAPTVNGFAITEISSPGSAALYAIDGLLQ